MQSHLVTHATQVEIMRPENLIVFKRFAGGP